MLNLPIEQIQISPTRQRRQFDPKALQELADSIDRNGLLQPLVVRPDESGSGWILVCGERRLRAVRDYLLPLGGRVSYGGSLLGAEELPCNPIAELDPLAAEEAELEENIRRVDLTWAERALATARLAALRTAQAIKRGDSTPTTAELSSEIRGNDEGYAHEATRREIIVSKHLGNPEVASAKTLEDAWKALKRNEETQRNVNLAAAVGRTFSAALHSIHQADALGWLEECPEEMFDVILTDPPYGIGADGFGDSGGKVPVGSHTYADDDSTYAKLLAVCTDHFFRIAKLQAHLYWFCDVDRFVETKRAFTLGGWTVFRTPLIWHKPNGNRAPWPDYGPHRKYEMVLYAMKGKRPTTKLYPDLMTYPSDDNLGWNAQKPVALFEDLLKRSTRPGDSVLDCFCGTGTIFPAAHALKVVATGIEQDPAAYGIALNRLKELK